MSARGKKKHVTRSRGYRLTPMGDGTAVPHLDRGAMPVPFWKDGMRNRDSLATETARKSAPELVQKITYDRVLDATGEHYVRVRPSKVEKSVSPRKVSAKVEQRASTRVSVASVDAMIRKTGYTGPITARMRSLARDVISHKISLARYAA